MADFDVKIALINDETVVYTGDNQMIYEANIILDELTKKLLNRFNYWVSMENSPYDRIDLELLGRLLYNVLLPTGETKDPKDKLPNLRELFEKEYAQFHKKSLEKDRFRLTLELHEEAGALGKYPWEFLFIPPEEKPPENEPTMDRGFFLAGERNKLILTRFVPRVSPTFKVKTEEPLRILVIYSHPKELGTITSEVTIDVIKSIKDLEILKHIEVRVEENPTHNFLYGLMNGEEEPEDADKKPEDRVRFKPDIFHFIGHGKPGQLALFRDKADIQADEDAGQDPIEEADWCDSEQVLKLFANHTPRLAFLHACESAYPNPKSVEGISDLARALVYAKVPIVVAMQYTIKNKDAALFAKKFYEEIREGSQIDEAVRAGREALGQAQGNKKSWADRRFGTPVVYFQSKGEQPLINVPRTKSIRTNPSDNYDAEEMVDCPNPRCSGHAASLKLALGSKACLECDHDLMHCPQCLKDKGEHRLMSKNIGRCGRCGYRLAERQVPVPLAGVAPRTEQAEAQSTGVAPRAEQAAVPSAGVAPRVEQAEAQSATSYEKSSGQSGMTNINK